MTTIDELREEIKVLHEEIKVLEQKVVARESKLEELERKKNEEGLSADKRKDIADEIAFIRALIPLEKRQITAILDCCASSRGA